MVGQDQRHRSRVDDVEGFLPTGGGDDLVDGGAGKFRYSDGSQLSLAQLGVKYQATWENWSLNLVGNGYVDGEKNSRSFK